MASKKNPDKVGKVTLAKCDEAKVREALLANGLKKKEVAALSFPEAVAKLTEFFEKNHKDDLADCEECGGASPTSLDACPFCGDSGITEGGEVDEEEGDDEETPAAADPPVTKPEPKKEVTKKDALVKKDAPPMELMPAGVTVEKLDIALSDFVKAKSSGAAAMWDLGKAAKNIYDGQLWKARIDESKAEDGTVTRKNTYKSWNEFCNKELGMTPANVFNLMDVANAFTREKVAEFGTTKLKLVLGAPEEAQPALLEAAKTHGKRALAAKVDEANKKAGGKKGKKVGRSGKKLTGAAGKKTRFKKNDAITIAALVEKKLTIQLFSKPEKGAELTVRASKLEEMPVGFRELDNKVNMLLSIKFDTTGKLVANVVFKPIEQDDEEDEEAAEGDAEQDDEAAE
jgi:hypothetical protein